MEQRLEAPLVSHAMQVLHFQVSCDCIQNYQYVLGNFWLTEHCSHSTRWGEAYRRWQRIWKWCMESLHEEVNMVISKICNLKKSFKNACNFILSPLSCITFKHNIPCYRWGSKNSLVVFLSTINFSKELPLAQGIKFG